MSSFVRCPDCGTKVYLQDEEPGDRLHCDECGRRFTWLAGDDAADRSERRRDRGRTAADRIETGMRHIRRKRPYTPAYLFALAGLPLLVPPTIWAAGLVSGVSFAPLGYIGLAIGVFFAVACLAVALIPWSTLGRLIAVSAICFVGCAGGLGLSTFQLVALRADSDDEWEPVENKWGFEAEMPKGRTETLETQQLKTKSFPLHKVVVNISRPNLEIALAWGDPPYFDGAFDDKIFELWQTALSNRGTVQSTHKTFIEAHRVFDFYVQRTDGRGYHLERVYVARRMGKVRLFSLTLIGPTVKPGCPEAKRFFESFHPGEF